MGEQRVPYILPVLALVIASLIYLSFISSINYGPEGTRFSKVLDFYPEIPPDSLLFIGESQIRENVNCHILEKSTTANCFNLGLNGIMPLQLALHKDFIISAKPKTVFLGISPSTFDETTNQNEDFFILLSDREIFIDNFMEKRLNNREKKLLSSNFFERALYKRKFIIPFYLAIVKQVISPVNEPGLVLDNFKDPHFFNTVQRIEILSEKLKNPQIAAIFEVEKGAKRQRDAFNYLINKLDRVGIEVVLIQMPLNPLAREIIPKNSLQIFDNYVQELANNYDLNLINMQDDFESEHFTDLTHLNKQGSTIFSEKLRGEENIIQ